MSEPKYSLHTYTWWDRMKLRWYMFKKGNWVISEYSPNPYPVGSDEWHYHNLTGGSWGHTETMVEVPEGISITGHYYSPEVLQMDNMVDLRPENVPEELREWMFSPSRQFVVAMKGFGDALEKLSYSAMDAQMSMYLYYSIYGQPRRLRWYERLWDWLQR